MTSLTSASGASFGAPSTTSAHRAFTGVRHPRSGGFGVVIDAVAIETPAEPAAAPKAPPEKPEPATAATPPSAATFHRSQLAPLAAAACLLAGIAGIIGGVIGERLLSHADRNVAAVTKANEELRTRVAAIEKAANEARAEMNRALQTNSRALGDARASATSQTTQLTARIDKLDHDLSQRLQTVEKSLASRDATASIHALPTPTPPAAPVINAAPRPQPGKSADRTRVPRGGWVLREVRDGGALVESAGGMRQVQLGEMLPGAGRVERIERRDGQWVLVTTNGFIDMTDY